MKALIVFLALTVSLSSFREQESQVEFICLKTHKASNTCHFNFKVDGAKFRYMDLGCKYVGKKEEIIQKAKEGTLALAKDWKIECPEPKEKKDGSAGL